MDLTTNKDHLKIRANDNASYVAWHVDEANNWNPVGAAWKHVDGNGYLVQLTKDVPKGPLILRVAHLNLN
ncbi:hypothetical protein [Mucilaginibacter sp. HD30]